jgi:erythromycin esterase
MISDDCASPFLVVCLLLLASGPACLSDEADIDAFSDWAGENAVVLDTIEPGSGFEDLEKIRTLVGGARVVCLGESRHDAHEHFRLKHRLIEFLVSEMGFTVFALEESLPCSLAIDEYVTGGAGDPEELLDRMGGWFIWNTREIFDLVEWMRTFNRDRPVDEKVRFRGIDITDPLPGIANVKKYLDAVDPDLAADIEKNGLGQDLFDPDSWERSMANFQQAGAERLDSLGQRLDDLLARLDARRAGYIGRSSEEEFAWARRQAWIIERAHALFATGVSGTFAEAGAVREGAMAANILWLLDEAAKGKRIIVWAHNFHVGRDTFDIDIPNRPRTSGMVPMIKMVGEKLGKDLVSFGFSFHRGARPASTLPEAGAGTLDAALDRAGPPLFVLDLRAAPADGPVHDWLFGEQVMRGEGGTARLVPARSFDAVVFTRNVTQTTKMPGVIKRLQALRR